MKSVRLLNPDYEYMFFDDGRVEEFVSQEFPNTAPSLSYSGLRFSAMISFDISLFTTSVGSILTLMCCWGLACRPFWRGAASFPLRGLTLSHRLRTELGMDWEIGNYAFGAAAGHPFLEAIIKNCVRGPEGSAVGQVDDARNPRLDKDLYSIFYSTGPAVLPDAG
jgi:hypothetical protein